MHDEENLMRVFHRREADVRGGSPEDAAYLPACAHPGRMSLPRARSVRNSLAFLFSPHHHKDHKRIHE